MDKKKIASGIGTALTMSNPWLAAGGAALGMLGSFFGGRRQSREAEKDRELRRQQLALERNRFGLEQQRYGDEMARMRARSEYMKPIMESYRSRSGSFAPTQRPQTALRGYMVGRQEDERA